MPPCLNERTSVSFYPTMAISNSSISVKLCVSKSVVGSDFCSSHECYYPLKAAFKGQMNKEMLKVKKVLESYWGTFYLPISWAIVIPDKYRTIG